MNDFIALMAVIVPAVLALVFRLPRRTVRLEKEVEILSKLEPGSPAHGKLSAHVEKLIDREIEGNESALQVYDFVSFVGIAAYGVTLIIGGFRLGGLGWIAFAVGILLCGFQILVLAAFGWRFASNQWRSRR